MIDASVLPATIMAFLRVERNLTIKYNTRRGGGPRGRAPPVAVILAGLAHDRRKTTPRDTPSVPPRSSAPPPPSPRQSPAPAPRSVRPAAAAADYPSASARWSASAAPPTQASARGWEQREQPLFGPRLASIPRRLAADFQVLHHGQIGKDTTRFRHVVQASPSDPVRRPTAITAQPDWQPASVATAGRARPQPAACAGPRRHPMGALASLP